MLVPYPHFGKTYRTHSEGVNNILGLLILEDGTDRLSRNVGKEIPLLAAW